MPPVSDNASLVIGLLVFVPAIEAGYRAIFGRGGVLAAALGGLLAVAGAVLIGDSRAPHTNGHKTSQLVRWSTATALASYVLLRIGTVSSPGSNIPGLIGLFAALIYWISAPAMLVSIILWIGVRIFSRHPPGAVP